MCLITGQSWFDGTIFSAQKRHFSSCESKGKRSRIKKEDNSK